MKKILQICVILGAFFGISKVEAVEYQSPRVLGLGGAGRASPLLNDSIYLNPSYASFNPIYSMSGGYTWFNQGRNYNISVQDARAEVFQAGVAYTKREQNAAVSFGASRVVVARLGVGIGSKILLDNETNKMTSDFIFSTSFIAEQWLYASFILDNVLETDAGYSRGLFRTFYLGFKLIPTKEVGFFIDPLYSPTYGAGNKAGVSLGVELSLLSDFYLRFGKFIDGEVSFLQTRGTGHGFGLGWFGPKINFDYAMTRVTSSHANYPLTTAHAVSTTIFF